jgi:phage recombination protein Bet
MSNELIIQQPAVVELAERFGTEANVFVNTMRSVSMPPDHTTGELISCLLVARQHGLNPLTREIYFMRAKSGKIVAIVAVDGWIKIANENPMFDGMDFDLEYDGDGKGRNLIGGTIKIYRKDRAHPICVYEDFAECRNAGGPVWKTSPNRMFRHRLISQGVRVAFGFAGAMLPDEFEAWQQGGKPAALDIDDMPDIDQTPQQPVEAEASQDIEDAEWDDPPIADEAGFIEHLKDQVRDTGGDVGLIAEVQDANAYVVQRMSDDYRQQAAQLYLAAIEGRQI